MEVLKVQNGDAAKMLKMCGMYVIDG